MSDFLTWENEIDEGAASGGFILHPAGSVVDFKVVKFERSQVKNPISAYNGAYMAKLELDAQGSKIFENIILHKKFEWKIAGIFKALGLMHLNPANRWDALLGACGQIKVSVSTYTSNQTGEEREKNDVDQYIEFNSTHMNSFLHNVCAVPQAPAAPVPSSPGPQNSPQGGNPWD